MDELLSVPSPEAAADMTQARLRFEAGMRLQKMAMDTGSAEAAQLLKLLGVGTNLDATA